FNRTPDQKLVYTVGIGIKDMVRHDTDFVSRSVEKYLRMEFDWKRRPIDVRDEQVDFAGKTYRHLSFDTVPLEEVGEFDAYREAWDGFNKKTKRCLRTVSEFEGFTEYMETKKLPPDISAYMGTPTKRLRRDLCRAFKNREAGFESVLSKRRVTHQEFCDALSDCGLGCKITDLDNAKRYPFEPHHSAATDEVITILQKLKDRHFPELDIGAFLPEVDDTVVEQVAA
ncbi:DNA-directed DNA polymerase, partial [Nitratireductor aquibiodomus RA22]